MEYRYSFLVMFEVRTTTVKIATNLYDGGKPFLYFHWRISTLLLRSICFFIGAFVVVRVIIHLLFVRMIGYVTKHASFYPYDVVI